VQGQLAYVWQELLTTQAATLQRLMQTTTAGDAASIWMRDFERPSAAAIASSWPTRLASAEAAMAQFQATTAAAGAGLGQLGTGAAQLGTGLQGFGASLAGTLQGIGAQH